jgi:hypothetical protein
MKGEIAMDIPVNAKVLCADGSYGRSVCVILNPATEQITHVAVEAEAFADVKRLVPLGLIRESTTDLIHLACTKADLNQLEIFSEVEFLPTSQYSASVAWPYALPELMNMTVEHEHVPPDELAIHRGTQVEAKDGRVGKVDEFLVEPLRYHITHLIMRHGHLWDPTEVMIPIGQIDRIEANTVYLRLTKREIEALPAIPLRRRKT